MPLPEWHQEGSWDFSTHTSSENPEQTTTSSELCASKLALSEPWPSSEDDHFSWDGDDEESSGEGSSDDDDNGGLAFSADSCGSEFEDSPPYPATKDDEWSSGGSSGDDIGSGSGEDVDASSDDEPPA